MQDEDDNDNSDAAFGRMMATHSQNMQNPSRPLDNADDSFTGERSASRYALQSMSLKPGVHSCTSLYTCC